jgi:hypothetical protein
MWLMAPEIDAGGLAVNAHGNVQTRLSISAKRGRRGYAMSKVTKARSAMPEVNLLVTVGWVSDPALRCGGVGSETQPTKRDIKFNPAAVAEAQPKRTPRRARDMESGPPE